jgi:hypothetical protein
MPKDSATAAADHVAMLQHIVHTAWSMGVLDDDAAPTDPHGAFDLVDRHACPCHSHGPARELLDELVTAHRVVRLGRREGNAYLVARGEAELARLLGRSKC